MVMEEKFLAITNAAHDYANTAQKVDTGGGDPMADVEPFEKLEDAVRAYGAARELKGHVDACKATNSEKALCGTAWRGMVWLCDAGKEIEELR